MITSIGHRVHHALALFELTVSDGKFEAMQAVPHFPFNASHYSEFKYGRSDFADQYGRAIAAKLIEHFLIHGYQNDPIVVIGTPYKRVPNAARMLSMVVERHLRISGFASSHGTIYQHRLADGDYGTLSAEARDQRNKDKKRYVDPDDFVGRHVVLIDDVRITGSIERSTLAHLDDVDVLSTTVVNLVRLDPEAALREPQLEDKLNHFSVKGLNDLMRLMNRRNRYTLTTRAVKYVLQSDPTLVKKFLERLGPIRTRELYEAIVDEGYDLMPRYRQVFDLVRAACSR
jgi:orotate phosphoribosyltransferase